VRISSRHRELWESEGEVVKNVYKQHDDITHMRDEDVQRV
jgi:hypothetical protein